MKKKVFLRKALSLLLSVSLLGTTLASGFPVFTASAGGSDNVNQGLTAGVFLSEGSTKPSGDVIHAVINSTNSSDVVVDDGIVYVDLIDENGNYITDIDFSNFEKDGDEKTFVNQGFESHIIYHIAEKNGKVIRKYFTMTIPHGATMSYTIGMFAENGLTPDNKTVLVKVGTENLGDEASDISTEGTVKVSWTADFGWDDVSKTVDTSKLAVVLDEGKNILSGDISYNISNSSQNTEQYGEIWTKDIVMKDILTLPEGISLPSGSKVSDDRRSIVDADGTTIISAADLDGGDISFEIEENKIKYTYTKTNSNKKDDRITSEMQNVNLKIDVKASALAVDISSLDTSKVIDNKVDFVANSVFDNKSESSDNAQTEIDRNAKITIAKTADKTNVESGEVVSYTISISNSGTKEITKDLVDLLPLGMTLSEEQKAAVKSTGATIDFVKAHDYNSEPNTYQITWPNVTLLPGQTVEKTISATVKTATEIKENNWIYEFDNTAKYNDSEAKAWVDFKTGTVDIEKSSDNNGGIVSDGQKVAYNIVISNKSEYDYKDEFTVTDTLPKGLILIGDDNQPLASGIIIESNGIIGRVTVDNNIYKVVWTIPDGLDKGSSIKLNYNTKLDQSLIAAGIDQNVTLTNTAVLSQGGSSSTDITTHINGVKYDKKIIDKQDNNTEKQVCETTVGGAYTYVLSITNDSDADVAGANAVDTLPTPNGKFNWSESLISIDSSGDFEAQQSGIINYDTYNASWTTPTIKWSGLTVPAKTTLKQKITITWPEGENGSEFGEYFETFSNPKTVRNLFSVNGGENVNADLTYKTPVNVHVVSQKGVYNIYSGDTETGIYKYFDGNETKIGYVYSFYNTSKESSVTVEKAIDQLPAGQSYSAMKADTWNGSNSDEITTVSRDNPRWNHGDLFAYLDSDEILVPVKIKASYDAQSRQITFSFFNANTDTPLVLNAGEGFSFLYECAIDIDTAMDNQKSTNSVKTKVISSVKPIADDISNSMTSESDNYGNVGTQIDDAEEDLSGNEYWYESNVSVEPGKIVPGIVKKSVSYRTGNGAWQPAFREVNGKQIPVTSMDPGDQFKWTITISNEENATASMIDYEVKDIPFAPYVLIDDSDFGITVNGITIPISLSDETIVSTQNNSDGTKTYTFKFSDSKFNIKPGEKAVLTVITKNGSNVETAGTYYNDAILTPSQSFKKSDVEKGAVIDDGKSVKSRASVNAFGAFGSFSYLVIHDKTGTDINCSPKNENPLETGIGYDSSDNYVYTDFPKSGQEASSVDFTINMVNASKINFEDIVIINKLPYPGDNGAVNLNMLRDSDFEVKLDPAKKLVVKIIDAQGKEQIVDSSRYKISFTGKGKEGYSENDWNGLDSSEWSDEISSDTLSFRVVFDKDFVLHPDEKITVAFHGIIGDDANPGEYAWDSFGYRYSATSNPGTPNANTQTLTASPAKVGLRIPFSPYIKKIVKSGENELPVNEKAKFKFKLYEVTGESVYTFKEDIEVSQGSKSPINTKYFYNNGEFKQNSRFVIVEVPSDDYETTFDGTASSDEVKTVTIDGVEYKTAYFFDLNDNDDIAIICTNKMETETVSKSVEKIWSDGNNQDNLRPESVTVQLYANEVPFGDSIVLNDSNDWSNTWTDLPKYDSNNAEISYTVDEISVPAGYKKQISTNDDGNVIITNTHSPEKTEFSAEKVWSDSNNQDGNRPTSITVQLYADGKSIDGKTVTLNEENSWKYTWTDLPKFGGTTTPIAYTVQETAVPDGYTASYTDTTDKTIITNSYTPGKTSLKVVKAWSDANNQDGLRPDKVTVQLRKTVNGAMQNVGEAVEVKASENWTYEWTELPEKENGKDIVYSVEETSVKGYIAEYNKADRTVTITNRHTPEKTEFSAEKIWSDSNNQDRNRPTSITVQLYADGKSIDGKTVTLNEENSWKHTWTDLPKFGGTTTPIAYTAKETAVPDGYTVSYANTSDKTTITNSYTPGKTSLKVVKTWSDAENQDGIRPSTIAVQLKKTVDGIIENVGEAVEIKASENWTYEWTELPEKENGKDVVYSVEEASVNGYTAEYSISDKTVIITNKHVSEKTNIDAEKVWDDSNDKDNIRPNSVKVQLYNDNGKVGEAIVLNKDNNWKTSWSDLPKYSGGKEIKYEVKEESIPDGYSVSYETDGNKTKVVNKHIPSTTPSNPTPTETPEPTTTPESVTKPSSTTPTTSAATSVKPTTTTTSKSVTTTKTKIIETKTTTTASTPLVIVPENPTPDQIRRTLALIDELLKRDDLTDEQRKELQQLRRTLSLMLETPNTGTDDGKSVPICAGGILLLLSGYSFFSRKKKFFE